MTNAALPLVIGTRNRNKGAEIVELLAPRRIAAVTLVDVPESTDIEETGDTFAANAALKAAEQAKHLKRWVLADDSGLKVDALGGAPGVYSARYAQLARGTPGVCEGRGGQAVSTPVAQPQGVPLENVDEANNRRLLDELGQTPLENRTAQYVCHVTLADSTGAIRAESHEVCHGRIRFEPVGANGFGYDPLFEVVEYHRTFGELGPHVKRALSHRARALRAILPKLIALLEV